MTNRNMDGIVIIGSGVAGMAAALELNRRDISFRIIGHGLVGGMANNASLIRNYPGFPKGISGSELMGKFIAQMDRYDIQLTTGEAKYIDLLKEGYNIEISNDSIFCSSVILATGTLPVKAGFQGEDKLRDSGILFYQVADLPSNSKNTVVIGSGDVAFDYALSAARQEKQVTVICRSAPRAVKFLRKCAESMKIAIIENDTVISAEIDGKAKVMVETTAGRKLEAENILIAVGRKANKSLLKKMPEIEIYPDGATSLSGVFLAGDVLHPEIRHIGIAVGDGIRAATMAAKSIAEKV